MKKRYATLLALASLVLVLGCSGNSSQNSKENSSSSIEESSISSEISSQDNTTSKKSSSSNTLSSSQAGYVDNQLSNDYLIVKFKANGASIDTIKWENKQIAKDGFTVGRVANRIAYGKFTLNDTQYSVSVNNGQHSLHGGQGSGMNSWRGPFATKDWTKVEQTASSITYSISSADGENGYPGKMDMTVKYTLNENSELSIEYSATATKDTLCNPTNHLFMNLNGSNQRDYSNVKLQILADNYTPLSNQIPTGAISPVSGTKFDYREETSFRSEEYDDNYVLNGTGYRKVATMTGGNSKISVDVYTDRPGLQLYKAGNGDICLETQMMPDMINHPEFDSYGTTILRAGETFSSKTTYAFSSLAQDN